MNFYEILDAFVLGRLLADELPIVASKGIECGYESVALHELADSNGLDAEHCRKLFLKAIQEIGLSLPTEDVAALSSARSIAKEVVDGRLPPYHGAKRIWDEIYSRFPRLEQLRAFVGMASEYEDDETHRDEYNQMIFDECKDLIATVENRN